MVRNSTRAVESSGSWRGVGFSDAEGEQSRECTPGDHLTNELFVVKEVPRIGTQPFQKQLVQRHQSFGIIGHLLRGVASPNITEPEVGYLR